MKKLLILGGSYAQIPIIKAARDMGHYVITCDYLVDNPGHQLAHEYYNVSTTDKEAVLSLAESLKVDGIVCYASDSAAQTVAFVGEHLGLPSHPYQSVKILSNKDLFREFQQMNHFNVPRAKSYHIFEEAKDDFHRFKLPVMVKPVDSSGSRGVSKIDSLTQLEEKVKNALNFSRNNRFLVEEYIERDGYHIGGDGFAVDGKLVFRSFTSEHFPSIRSLNPFVPIGATWPCLIPEHIQEKIHNEIQRVLDLLNMSTGAFNFDIQVDQKENVYLIEISARNGGGGALYPEVIKAITGVDLLQYTIQAALGEDCSNLTMTEPQGYWVLWSIVSQKSGVLKTIEIDEEIIQFIVAYDLEVELGESISALTGANDTIGSILLEFSSMDEMLEKMEKMNDWVKIIVEDSYITKRIEVK